MQGRKKREPNQAKRTQIATSFAFVSKNRRNKIITSRQEHSFCCWAHTHRCSTFFVRNVWCVMASIVEIYYAFMRMWMRCLLVRFIFQLLFFCASSVCMKWRNDERKCGKATMTAMKKKEKNQTNTHYKWDETRRRAKWWRQRIACDGMIFLFVCFVEPMNVDFVGSFFFLFFFACVRMWIAA